MSELYERIEMLCQEKNKNITSMCSESGASRGALSDLKSGRIKSLSASSLQRIADYFGVSIDYLLGKEKSPSSDKLTEELGDLEFALFGEVKDLTDGQKKEILDFVKFKKSQGEWMK